MSETTRRLMGDPPPGRTPWSEPGQHSKPRSRPGRAERIMDRISIPADAPVLPSRGKFAALPVGGDQTTSVPDERYAALMAVDDNSRNGNSLRPVQAMEIDTTLIPPPPTGEPIFERMDPRVLLVDGNYQRDLSPKSLALIERIAKGWDWRRFKPPVVAFAEGGMQIIDGQHTAIAAASRPDIDMIPVMVVDAPELTDRAKAFIGHNKDRVAVTPMQIHHAAVAAGDAEALAIEGACDEAGVTLVRSPYGSYKYKIGESIAITAIAGLIKVHGVAKTVAFLKVLVAAGLAPIRADHIKAVELLFTDPDYADNLEPLPVGGQDLATAIQIAGDQATKDAKVFASAQDVPLWKAMAVVWFKKTRKRRRAS